MVTTDQPAIVEQRIVNENKSTALAYVLWFVTGALLFVDLFILPVAIRRYRDQLRKQYIDEFARGSLLLFEF
jgi:hypothetical protein